MIYSQKDNVTSTSALFVSPADPLCAFLGHWPAGIMLFWSSCEALRDLKQ